MNEKERSKIIQRYCADLQRISRTFLSSGGVQIQAGANYIGIASTDYSGAIQITVE